jgi:hypothetical protein
MAKGNKTKKTRARSAETGEFVKKSYAAANKRTTVVETVKPKRPRR